MSKQESDFNGDVEFYSDPIVAYRQFILKVHTTRRDSNNLLVNDNTPCLLPLTGKTKDFSWGSGVNTATCLIRNVRITGEARGYCECAYEQVGMVTKARLTTRQLEGGTITHFVSCECSTNIDKNMVQSSYEVMGGATHNGVPGDSCTCGIWGLNSVEALSNTEDYGLRKPKIETLGWLDFVSARIRINGAVGLFGKVIVGEKGYRAEKARILSLYLDPDTQIDDPSQTTIQLEIQKFRDRWRGIAEQALSHLFPSVPVMRSLDELAQKFPASKI